MNEAGDEREPPWASLLDPVANARALADVQALGLRAAGELVERFVRSVDDDGPVAEGDARDDAAGPAGSSREVGRLLEVWMELLRQTATTFASTNGAARPGPEQTAPDGDAARDGASPGDAARSGEPAGVRLAPAPGSPSGPPRVVVDPTGAAVDGVAELWLHNDTLDPVGPVALHCGDLRSSEGDMLAAALHFEPARIRELPARSGRGIRVCVGVAAPLPPGTYRTVVQVAGAPEVWTPLEVVVAGAPS